LLLLFTTLQHAATVLWLASLPFLAIDGTCFYLDIVKLTRLFGMPFFRLHLINTFGMSSIIVAMPCEIPQDQISPCQISYFTEISLNEGAQWKTAVELIIRKVFVWGLSLVCQSGIILFMHVVLLNTSTACWLRLKLDLIFSPYTACHLFRELFSFAKLSKL